MFLNCFHKEHRDLHNLASQKPFCHFVWLLWLWISIMLYLLITGYLCLPWGSLSHISCSVVHRRELGIFSGVHASRLPPEEIRGRGNPVYFLSLLLPLPRLCPPLGSPASLLTFDPPASGCSQLSLVTSPWVSSPSFLRYKSPLLNSSVIHTVPPWLLTDLTPYSRYSHLEAFPGYVESWAPKNWCFWPVVLEKTLESYLHCKEIQSVHTKGDQSWIFIGRTDAEAGTPILRSPDVENWLIGKDPDAGKDWGQEEKGMTEDEMVGWHYRLNGHEFE